MTSDIEAMQQRAAEARKAAGMEVCVRCGVTRYLKELTDHACTKPEECGMQVHLTGEAAQLVYSTVMNTQYTKAQRDALSEAEKLQLQRFREYLRRQAVKA